MFDQNGKILSEKCIDRVVERSQFEPKNLRAFGK